MRIAVSQINTRAGDLAHTAERMQQASEMAVGREVDLLVFPVTTLTGPLPLPLGAREAFMDDLYATLSHLATSVACDCLVPFVTTEGEYPAFDAILLSGGRIISQRRRQSLSLTDIVGLPDGARPSLPLSRFESAGSRIGLAFSYEDLDVWCERPGDVDVICYLASYSFAVDDPSSALGSALGEGRFVRDAEESRAWLVGVGPVGGYGNQVFSGSSFALSPEGRLAASAAAFEEDLLVADVGKGVVLKEGAEVQPEFYDVRYHLWQALVLGIHDFVWKLGRRDVALMLDGSLSSMLTAVLATDALGPTNVHALLGPLAVPSREAEISRLARALRLDLHTAPEEGSDDELLRRDIAEARLSALSREFGAVTLSCGDKTSFALELSGRPMGNALLAPLGDVYRIDVLDVARLRNTISQVLPQLEVTPDDVPDIGAPIPSWGCEALLERMDLSLSTHVEGGRSLTETAATIDDEGLATAVIEALRRGEAYRVACPPCLLMTTRTLFDAHMPLGFAWEDHLRKRDASDGGARPHSSEGEDALGFERDDAPVRRWTDDDGLREGELREALELLRDIALGARDEWAGTFSEN